MDKLFSEKIYIFENRYLYEIIYYLKYISIYESLMLSS